MPVRDAVVDAEGEAAAVTGRGHLVDDVAMEGRVHDVIVGLLGVPEAETVHVFGDHDDVAHAGRLRDADPLVGIKLHRIEPPVELIIFRHRHLVAAGPAQLGTGQRDRTPMDEESEPTRLKIRQRHG